MRLCVCACVCPYECVCALAFKGAPSLAHVSMRVRVHLCGDAWSDAAWAHSVWPLTFLQCCRVAVFKSAWMSNYTPPSPRHRVPLLLLFSRLEHCCRTELSRTYLCAGGQRVWFQMDDAALACMSSEQPRERESQGNVHFYLNKIK